MRLCVISHSFRVLQIRGALLCGSCHEWCSQQALWSTSQAWRNGRLPPPRQMLQRCLSTVRTSQRRSLGPASGTTAPLQQITKASRVLLQLRQLRRAPLVPRVLRRRRRLSW